ncbi:MerR family transcriptional regulator [Clostridium hydrogenum]|uniref:MerR family transcriptional regulator n=1 Tax=Clostridium hydrogenum TaxID=2855764 RepID=UPI001F2B7C78|nr:MerR family transcriptional regulator [Clostridium hydrogenum]
MRTVKQVSDLTGISVRMLHHYDKIGLLKPTKLTEAGYRLYDDEALEILQQILFFKELDLPLKQIKQIVTSPNFDKMKALESHKKLIVLKRDRLNGLIELINKTLGGDNTMSFKEFDMSEYYNVWREYLRKNKNFDELAKFEQAIEKRKVADETKTAKNIIKQYGSMEKAVEVMRKNLNDSTHIKRKENYEKFENDFLYDKNVKLNELYKRITADLTKIPSSNEFQQIAEEITDTVKRDYEIFKTSRSKGDSLWYHMMTKLNSRWAEIIDNKYGSGAAKFIEEVFKIYLKDKKPKLDKLYDKLAGDLSKNPASEEIQKIVEEIATETKSNVEFYKGDTGLNYKGFFSVMADVYLSNANKGINSEYYTVDKKYGEGAAKFIGEAFKFYSEGSN